MIRICSTKGMTEKEWLEQRRNGIGGSDASVILGINQYRSIFDLWEDKCGIAELDGSNHNDYTHFGHVMESVIRDEFKRRTGLSVRQRHFILGSEDHPWMIADLDGVVKEDDGSYAIFEAKTASEYKREVWESKVPDEYYAQVQHYMAVTGYKKAYIAAIVGGNSYYCHEVERNDSYIDDLIKAEAKFWKNVMLGIRPEADASCATVKYLNKKYADSQNTEIQLPESAVDLIEDFKATDEEIKQLNLKKNGISNQLKELMQENEVGKIGEHLIKWSTVVRKNLNTDIVKSLLGDEYEHCLTEIKYRKLSVA